MQARQVNLTQSKRVQVPHTWCVINDQDAVARQAKFLLWYKRAGQRVLINPDGDMLVSPSAVPSSLHCLVSTP